MSSTGKNNNPLTRSDIRRQSVVKKALTSSMAAVFSEWVILARRAYAQSERLFFLHPIDEQILETLHELDAETVDQCCHQQASVVINQLTVSSTPILARLVDRADALLRNQHALAQLLGFSNNEPLSLKQEAISALARGYADLLILAVRSQRDVNAPLGLIMPLSRAEETILAKLNHEVVWAASHDVANSVFKSDHNHILARQMQSLFAKLGAAIEENRLINRFIVNGASNSQIHDLFGLHAQETGWRRRVLGVAAPAGRIMRYDHPYRVLKVWQAISAQYPDERYRYLAILEQINDITLGQVHKIVTQAAGLLAPRQSIESNTRSA